MTLPAVRPPVADQAGDVTLVHPSTGEVIPLDASDATLAEWLDAVREWERLAKQAKAHVYAEVLRRMDNELQWTRPAGDFKLVGQSPSRTEYDLEALEDALRPLVVDGTLSPDQVAQAIVTETKQKVSVAGVNRLAKLGPRVAEAIKSAERPVDGDRRVQVRRAV